MRISDWSSDVCSSDLGTYRVHRHTIRDTHAYGTLSVKKAFEVSSNVAITKIINTYSTNNPAAFTKGLRELHLNEPLGLQIPGEGNPLLKTHDSKSCSGQIGRAYVCTQVNTQHLV